jgi:hypothetical protein
MRQLSSALAAPAVAAALVKIKLRLVLLSVSLYALSSYGANDLRAALP